MISKHTHRRDCCQLANHFAAAAAAFFPLASMIIREFCTFFSSPDSELYGNRQGLK